MNKYKENENKIKKYYKFIIFIILLAIIVLMLVNLYSFNSNMQDFKENKNLEYNALAENTLTIISIGLTMWFGLNVYNVLERKEMDYMKEIIDVEKEKLHELSREIDLERQEIIEMKSQLNEDSKKIENFFINGQKNQLDISFYKENTWYSLFKEFNLNNSNNVSFEIYNYLLRIEHYYRLAFEYNDLKRYAKLKEFSLVCLNACNECLEMINKHNMWYIYLVIRKSDALFFLGNYYRFEKKINSKCIKNYTEALEILDTINNYLEDDYISLDLHNLFRFYNTIAIIHIYLSDIKESKKDKIYHLSKSIEILELSLPPQNTSYALSLRNYASSIERLAYIKYDESSLQWYKSLEIAEKMYVDAIKINPNEYISCVNLASVFIKELEFKYGIIGKLKKNLKEKIEFEPKEINECKTKVLLAEQYLKLAKSINAQYYRIYEKKNVCLIYKLLIGSDSHELQKEFEFNNQFLSMWGYSEIVDEANMLKNNAISKKVKIVEMKI